MNLFIQGGGGSEKSFELDRLFSNKLNKDKPLLYIPVAIDFDKHNPQSCFDWITTTLEPLGVTKITMWLEEDFTKTNLECLANFSGIYIGGGNTFKLINLLRQTSFADEIKKLAVQGVPIYGGSAGGIIMAKTTYLALSADENFVGVTDFRGLNLVKDFNLCCHYEPNQIALVEDFIQKYSMSKLIALTEETGLFVTEDSITVVGPGSAMIFPGRNTLPPGSTVK